MTNITDRLIYDLIGDMTPYSEVKPHASEIKADMKMIFKALAADCETEEEFFEAVGELLDPLREMLGDDGEEDELTEAFRAYDRLKARQGKKSTPKGAKQKAAPRKPAPKRKKAAPRSTQKSKKHTNKRTKRGE